MILAAVFVVWLLSERTLSIHSIYTLRREAFYWAAVMAAFALGTATGDLTATTLHLGYLLSGVVFAGLIAIPALAYRLLGLNEVLAFWIAYVLTRPLGASFADWTSKPHPRGLAFGDGPVSLCATILVVVFVAFLAVTRKDVKPEAVAERR